MRASRIVRLVVAVLSCAAASVFAFASDAAPEGARAEVARVVVTGTAVLENVDHVNAARMDAMRQAIQQVGGAQVRAHEAVRFGELVKKFTYVRAEALVESVEPAGPPETSGGVYRQAFVVKVRPAQVYQDLVKERFDVEFLYDVIQRPRILVAVLDEWNPSGDPAAPFVADPDQASRQLIMQVFRERHADIVFQEPRLLREGSAGLQALIEEARGDDFEILIVGETRSSLVGGIDPARAAVVTDRGMSAGGLPDARAKLQRISSARPSARPRFDVAVNWSVVDVATRRQIVGVRDARPPAPEDPADFDGAKRIAKETLIRAKAAEVFRELVLIWTQRAFSTGYELVFRTGAEVDAVVIATALRERAGFVADSVKMTDSRPGRFRFTASAALGPDEIRANLNRVFGPGIRVVASQGGRFELEAAEASALRVVMLTVAGVSLGDARALQAALEKHPEVAKVARQPVAGGRAPLQITTTLNDDDLGLAVENALPGRLRILAQGPAGIEFEAMPAPASSPASASAPAVAEPAKPARP